MFSAAEALVIMCGLAIGCAIDAASRRIAAGHALAMGADCERRADWRMFVPFLNRRRTAKRCETSIAGPGLGTALTALAGALTALAAVWLTPADVPFSLGFTLLLGWLLLALAVIDQRSLILPDPLNALVLAGGAVMVAVARPEAWTLHLAGAAAGFASLYIIEVTYRRFRGFEGLGRGDAKLFGAIGAWIGLYGLPPALLIASATALAATLAQALVLRKSVSGTTKVPFGPWIALGGYCVWLAPALQLT
jgi:leader peptidase (prepilin peptidase)/N-methyltransferase